MTKERPILFSAPMVRALLDGSKTQTRRAVTMPPSWDCIVYADWGGGMWPYRSDDGESPNYDNNEIPMRCPYGRPGDRLYVRETWSHDAPTLDECRVAHEDAMSGGTYGPYYRATEIAPETLQWRPSIHMPRWASRILLEITSVRVERLNAISEDDAFDEGIKYLNGRYTFNGGMHESRSAKESFSALWESINGAGSWDANPWVWAITVRKVTP